MRVLFKLRDSDIMEREVESVAFAEIGAYTVIDTKSGEMVLKTFEVEFIEFKK